MATYNHAAFIRQAVESALMQDTDFDVEIVIGEDCSTDNTGEICQELANLHPDRIRLFRRPSNCGMHQNSRMIFDACRGTYIAFLEGDDYWTDARKLARQVRLLKQNPSWSGCFHKCEILDERIGGIVGTTPRSMDRPFCEPKDLLLGNVISNLSVIIRRSMFEYPPWISSLPMGDWPIWILASMKGPIGFLNEKMGVYRIHSGGTWSQQPVSLQLQNILQVYDALEANCPEISTPLLREGRSQCIARLSSYARCMEERTGLLQRENQAYMRSATWRAGRVLLAPYFALRGLLRAFSASQVRNQPKADAVADRL